MKKLIAILLCAVFVFTLAACGGNGGGDEKEGLSVVLVVPNNLGDLAFADMVWSGVTRANETYKFKECKCIELLGDATIQESTLKELAEDGTWDIIVTGTFSMKEAIINAAKAYQDQKFIVYDMELDYTAGDLNNCVSYSVMQNEAAFLAGALGALLTSSDIDRVNSEKLLGFVGGKENTSIFDFLVGYIEGMQYVDADCKVLYAYVGGFTDTAKAKELALAQYNQGVDIVFAVCSGAGLGVYDAAKENSKWAFGVDSDQSAKLAGTDADAAASIITSAVKHLDVVLYDAFGAYIDGTIEWGTHTKVSLASDGVGLAENEYYTSIVPADIRAQIADIAAKIASGEIVVSSAYGMSTEDMEKIFASGSVK